MNSGSREKRSFEKMVEKLRTICVCEFIQFGYDMMQCDSMRCCCYICCCWRNFIIVLKLSFRMPQHHSNRILYRQYLLLDIIFTFSHPIGNSDYKATHSSHIISTKIWQTNQICEQNTIFFPLDSQPTIYHQKNNNAQQKGPSECQPNCDTQFVWHVWSLLVTQLTEDFDLLNISLKRITVEIWFFFDVL